MTAILTKAGTEDNERNEKSDPPDSEVGSGFTLLDIMGQVVRNFPLELRADLKLQLTAESYALCRRLETSFLQTVQTNYEPLAQSLRDLVRRHQVFAKKSDEDIAYASNMFLVGIVEGVTLAI